MRNQLLVNLIKRLISKGQTEGLQEKLDVFLLVGSINIDDYNEFQELMGKGVKA